MKKNKKVKKVKKSSKKSKVESSSDYSDDEDEGEGNVDKDFAADNHAINSMLRKKLQNTGNWITDNLPNFFEDAMVNIIKQNEMLVNKNS